MKLFITSFLSVLLFGLLFTTSVNALTSEIVSENGNEKVYNILAVPPKESSAIQMRITVLGATITNVEPGDPEKLSYIATCENSEPFFEENICMEVAATGGLLVNDQVLLVVTVNALPDEEVIFSANSDHAYLTTDNELMTEEGQVIEVIGNNNVVDEPAPVVDEAKTNETNSLPFVLLLGILVVLVGAFLVIIFFTGKDSKKK